MEGREAGGWRVGGMGGCRGGVCGIWSMFGLEVTAPALSSQEDNGKEGRRKEGLWMCVYTHRWSAHTLGGKGGGLFVCQYMCVFTELCKRDGTDMCACVCLFADVG